MDKATRKSVLKRVEEILSTKDLPPDMMASVLCNEVIDPLIEHETSTWKALAYAMPE